MIRILQSSSSDPDFADMTEKEPPTEHDTPTEDNSSIEEAMPAEDNSTLDDNLLIEELEILLEEMQCQGYDGASGVEDQLCGVCDEILSMIPPITLDTLQRCGDSMLIYTRAHHATQVWAGCT